MSFNFYDAIHVNAIWAVINQDNDIDAKLRHIFRWYSKTFHTPLHIVEDLPIDDILIAYYEDRFEELDEEDRLEEMRRSVLSKEELEEMERRMKESDDEFYRQVQEEAAREAAAAAKAKEEKDRIATLQAPAQKPITKPAEPQQIVTETEETKPLIKMTFEKELDLDIDSAELMVGDFDKV